MIDRKPEADNTGHYGEGRTLAFTLCNGEFWRYVQESRGGLPLHKIAENEFLLLLTERGVDRSGNDMLIIESLDLILNQSQ